MAGIDVTQFAFLLVQFAKEKSDKTIRGGTAVDKIIQFSGHLFNFIFREKFRLESGS